MSNLFGLQLHRSRLIEDVGMQIYWTLKHLPEFADLSSSERGRIWRAVHWKVFRHWQAWLALISLALLAGLGSSLGQLAGQSTIGLAIGAGIGAFLYMQVIMHFARPHIRELLSEAKSQ